ncbi:MAG TPA: histidine kinase [Streptosporangiaceae bacterium]|nr:histidine kinase [Streptosporangiaceae bacterium]
MGTLVFVLAVAIWLAGMWVLWRRRGADIKAAFRDASSAIPEGIRSRGWGLLLVVLTLLAVAGGEKFLLGLGAAIVLVIFAPRVATRLLPWALIIYGCIGYLNAKDGFPSFSQYGLLGSSWTFVSPWQVPEAALYIVAGVWLFPRLDAVGYGTIKALFGRLRGGAGGQSTGGPAATYAPLLLPVLLVILELFGVDGWFGVGWWRPQFSFVADLVILAAGIVLVARVPERAVAAALAGIVILGTYGILLALFWPGVSGGFYGAMLVNSKSSAVVGGLLQGTALLSFAGWLAPRVYRKDAELAARAEQLTERVETLTQTRTDAVDTAVAELRRIERDLHDGAQARLVALGMSLQAAERLFATSPEAALALVSEAKESSSKALTELRDLVRGIYPPVLADRGLADAVRALALDTPLHTQTDIDLPAEIEMPVASAVYFAIAEILTNAVRHSGARTIKIQLSYAAIGMLRAQVTDDGAGGADPSQGTGLNGIERRLATFDGILAVNSPPGGPTIVVIEVPCALSSPKTSSC